MGSRPPLTLVTGGTGVVGRAVVAALRARGDAVVVLARGPGADVRGDVTDAALLAGVGAARVVHLAGDALGGDAVNVEGTRAVLAAVAADAPRVVVASTLAVHGPREGAVREDLPLAPASPYAASKAAAEAPAREAGAIVARLANVYGPGPDHPSRLVPELVAAVREGRAPRMRSGATTARDLVHADDAARGLIALLDAAEPGETYNIGSGVPTSLGEAVAVAERLAGRPLGAVFPEADHGVQWADVGKIADAVGWRPRVSFAEGLGTVLGV